MLPGAKNGIFFEFSLCLSRACLGKMFVFIYKWLKNVVFRRLPRRREVARWVALRRTAFYCWNFWVVLFGCVLFLAIMSALCLPLFCLLPLISPPATLGLLLAWSTRCLLWPACLCFMYVASSAIIHRTSRGHAEHVAAGGRPAIEAEVADWVGSTGYVRCSKTASPFFVCLLLLVPLNL